MINITLLSSCGKLIFNIGFKPNAIRPDVATLLRRNGGIDSDHCLSAYTTPAFKLSEFASIFIFEQVILDWPEDLGRLFDRTGGQIDPQHAGIVKAEIDLFSVRHLHHEGMAKVLTERFDGLVAS